MEKMRVLLAKFDVDGFVETEVRHLKNRVSDGVNPIEAIEVYDYRQEDENDPCPSFETQEAIVSELRFGNTTLFMAFADFHEDGTICADGKVYTEGKVDELDDDGTVVGEEFFVGMEQSIGYLVHREGDSLVFESAVYECGSCPTPGPSVELIEDCSFLDGPMISFVDSFAK